MPPKNKSGSDQIIQVENLTKKFNGLIAVDNLSFGIRLGDICAFLGPNGAGKTTTIRMLTTLLKPSDGKMLVNGYDPQTQKDQVRKSFGVVFQDSSLDEEFTAWENMEFHGILYKVPRTIRSDRIRELLEIVGLWQRKDDLVKTYSGGMRRRLEIVRGLLHHPKILFLDEPTLGLDPQTRNKIWEQIRILNRNHLTTIFFTTHYLDEAEKMSTYIVIIDNGKIAARGTAEELKKQTRSDSLENAYLTITGKDIREETISNLEKMRMFRQKRK